MSDAKIKQTSLEKQNALLDESYKAAYNVAYKLLGHKESAQDVAIESVSRLIEKKFDDKDFAPSYCARVSARLVISSWRKDAVARKYATKIEQGYRNSNSEINLAEVRLDLRKALQKLSKRQREVIVLRYLADLQEQQVADFLEISIGTVKSTTADALSRLRTMVEVSP